jgi:hypothetical protein
MLMGGREEHNYSNCSSMSLSEDPSLNESKKIHSPGYLAAPKGHWDAHNLRSGAHLMELYTEESSCRRCIPKKPVYIL